MLFLKSVLRVLLLTFISLCTNAQVYPIQGSAALMPPFSVKLPEYSSSVTDRIVVNVLLNDFTRPELKVRFRLRIESQSIKLETKGEYIGNPISLIGGSPLRLTNVDLAEYFNPNNLNFSGISKSEFLKSGTFPEGLYQFCFDVLEYNRGVKISNTICAPAWLILNDPPLVNLPRNGEKLKPLSVQNVVFQWTPRHTGSPNSAFTTEYEFKLVEIWPSNRNPNDAILSQPSIYETVTGSTMLVYGPDATPLELGRHYAFRIRARSITGVDQLDLFKNNGYSEVYSFIYGDACTAPTNIEGTPEGSSRFNVSWTENPNHTNYILRYQLADKNTDWYLSNSLISDIQINEVAPSTRYQFQVKAFCGNYESDFTPIAYVATNAVPNVAYSCGVPLNIPPPDPSQLIQSLKVGDIITAGDFPVRLTAISGSNGIFSGEGVVEIPFFNKARAKVEFTNINVNQELRLVAGVMNVTGGAVDVVPSAVMDFMDDLTEVLNMADSLLDVVEKNLPEQFDENSFVADTEVRIDGTIKQIYKAADGTVVVVDDKGNATTIPAGTTAAVIDSNGNAYLVDAKGKAHAVSAAVAEKAARREYNLSATFANASDSKFGFDAKRYDALTPHYEKVDDQFISWKSVETGKTDAVAVQLNGANDQSKVHFEQGGIGIGHQALGLTIRGSSDGVEEGLLALYTPPDSSKKEQVIGKLNVVTYNAIHHTVVMVPVNGNEFNSFGTPEQLRDNLNAIYNQAVVHWNVEVHTGINIDNISPFDVGETGMLSNYSDHMKKVINAYQHNIRKDAHYLFLVSNASKPSTLGFMPRSRSFGFIFADQHSTLTDIARTIAHELAHGTFNLHHTFQEPNFTLTKGTTDNLLDYPAGDKLYKFQWDKIRYPDIVMGMFEEDDEAALTSKPFFADYKSQGIIIHVDQAINNKIIYLTPSGKPFALPPSAEPSFTGQFKRDDGTVEPVSYPEGSLLAFKEGTEIWTASIVKRQGLLYFKGYVKSTNRALFKEIELEKSSSLVAFIGKEDDYCNLVVYFGDYPGATESKTGYRGEGEVSTLSEFNINDPGEAGRFKLEDCIPNAAYNLPPVPFDLFSNNIYARYNYYKDGGVLLKLTNGEYFYSNVDDQGNQYYKRWVAGAWVPYNPAQPNCTSCDLKLILSIHGILGLFKEVGHDVLDAGGLIPVAGEAFDGINGVWYAIEGDAINAGVSFSSAVPVVGWASTGGKWILKYSKVGKVIKAAGKFKLVDFKNPLEEIVQRMNDLGFDETAANALNADLHTVLKAGSEGSPDVLLLDKFVENPRLVDAWRVLKDAGRTTLKVDPNVLTKLNKVLQNSKLDNFLPINTSSRSITNKIELVQQIVKLQDEAGSIVGKRMTGMDDLMADIDHFLSNFANKPGANEFIKELTESGGKMAGGSFVLKTLKNNAGEVGTIVKFESTIASQVEDVGDIVVDVITDKGVLKNVFNEFKNWRSIPTNRYGSFSKQFSGYLTNKNIGQFSYFFKKGVDGNGFNNLSELKDQVLNAISSSAGRAELSNVPLPRVQEIVDDFDLLESNKVQVLVEFIGNTNNFEDIFKLID